ncbi:DUF4388 domain-containing protein [Cryptosporangium arvum]|uniref:DUF4388 domain-containing protein n=1 Tax=Cryptosporangium arvum TaxID=80871 RepID=UPI0012ED00D6|nr:DUF4388 domain-containing protein [Cryptosporangium arvum]
MAATLRELATLGATGALHVEAFSGAVLYLQDGAVTHVDAGSAPGIGTLLTASGRLSKDVWESVLTVGGPTGRVGALLVEQGYLSQGELELCVNGALFDAAYFALTLEPTSVKFVEGERSWFGGALRVDVERLVREVTRRQDQLTRVFPSSEFDSAALTLVARLPKEQIVVDGLRWELLLSADGRRTPLELARMLGRGGFATLLEVRRLAAIGLALSPSATGAAARPAVTPYRPAVGSSAVKAKPASTSSTLSELFGPGDRRGAAEPVPPARAGASAPSVGDAEGAPSSAPLPRRVNGAGTNGTGVTGTGTNGRPANGGSANGAATAKAPLPPLPRRGDPIEAEPVAGERIQPLPPLPKRVPTRVVRPSQQGRAPQEPGDPAPALVASPGPRWPSPPPEIYAEAPSLSSLRRFRDALQEFS